MLSAPHPFHPIIETVLLHETPPPNNPWRSQTHLIKIDNWLPELILRLVEIPHADFPKVTRVIFVEIGPMMMLSTSHTATAGMLAVLAYTAVAGRDVATAMEKS